MLPCRAQDDAPTITAPADLFGKIEIFYCKRFSLDHVRGS
jgi:hypothetical protein